MTGVCQGHEPGPFDPMGVEVYCDGTCRPVPDHDADDHDWDNCEFCIAETERRDRIRAGESEPLP